MIRMMTRSNVWGAIATGEAHTSLPSFAFPNFTIRTRTRIQSFRLRQTSMSLPNAKKANLSATRKENIKLPNYDGDSGGKAYHISEFLSHPSGIQAMLNTSALQSFQLLDTNTYRCTLPKVQFLNFEAAPVMDLRVTPTNKDCTVQLLSCKVSNLSHLRMLNKNFQNLNYILAELHSKFEGSDIVERQNDHFSAFMINHMTWHTNDSDSFLEVDVKLNLSLEIYTRPFTLLPISAVERPGNINCMHPCSNNGSVVTYRMMQALVDRLVPLLLQQLLQDYDKWVHQNSEI